MEILSLPFPEKVTCLVYFNDCLEWGQSFFSLSSRKRADFWYCCIEYKDNLQ